MANANANSAGSWWRYVWSASVEAEAEANADVTLEQVLEVVNLSAETKEFIKQDYPTLEEFEKFVKLLFDGGKSAHETHGELKKPRFKRSDRQEFIILRRWTEKKTEIDWGSFNEESFNDLRKQAPKHDLLQVLKELGIDNEKVLNTLKAKKIEKLVHFVQKPKSWYNKLEEEKDTEGDEPQQQQQQPNQLLLNGSEQIAIEKFKEWYNYHSIGFLPSNWICSFNEDVLLKERELRKILRMIGLNADAIEALEMNGIKDIENLNLTSKNWRSETESRRGQSFRRMEDGEQESRSDEWKLMGLTQNDARRIIRFRHWHTFYVAGKPNMTNWPREFNSAHYDQFVQRYCLPGDDFEKPSRWKFWKHDSLNLSQEKHDYYDVLQKALEAGEVTSELRYHILNCMDKKEKMLLIDGIISSHYEGHGDSTLDEDRLRELLQLDEQKAEEKGESKLLFCEHFCRIYSSAVLVFALMWLWVGTTIYFIRQANKERDAADVVNATMPLNNTLAQVNEERDAVDVVNATGEGDFLTEEKGFEEHPGFDFVTFIHNVLFGLVTAVVVQELGEDANKKSLYYRILPIYRDLSRRQREYGILNRRNASSSCCSLMEKIWEEFIKPILLGVILLSTRAYILVWIGIGIASLAIGGLEGIDSSNPLYVTGQAWLGVAVTISFTFFGLSSQNTGAVQGITDESGTANDKKEATRRVDGETKAELETRLAGVEAKIRAALDGKDFIAANKLCKAADRLQTKMKDLD